MMWEGLEWINLAQNRDQWHSLVNGGTNLQVPSNARILSSGQTISFSRKIIIDGVRITYTLKRRK
jgi:hypothetical protein